MMQLSLPARCKTCSTCLCTPVHIFTMGTVVCIKELHSLLICKVQCRLCQHLHRPMLLQTFNSITKYITGAAQMTPAACAHLCAQYGVMLGIPLLHSADVSELDELRPRQHGGCRPLCQLVCIVLELCSKHCSSLCVQLLTPVNACDLGVILQQGLDGQEHVLALEGHHTIELASHHQVGVFIQAELAIPAI